MNNFVWVKIGLFWVNNNIAERINPTKWWYLGRILLTKLIIILGRKGKSIVMGEITKQHLTSFPLIAIMIIHSSKKTENAFAMPFMPYE